MNDYETKLIDIMKVINHMKSNNAWSYTTEDVPYEEEESYRDEAIASKKKATQVEGMLLRLMKHLRSTGEDVLVVLKDEELHKWWTAQLKDILKEEAKQAAMEKAMASLSEEERKALGLKF